MYRNARIGVVVLAYNVGSFVESVIEGLPGFIDAIYIVDDGSTDNTSGVIGKLNNHKVNLISHKHNLGPGAGLRTGYRAALADDMNVVVKVDGDGQMPLDQIENLINPIIEKRADYTKGNRLFNRSYSSTMPRFRLLGNYLLTWLTRIESGYWHVSDSQNGYVAISRKALQTIDLNFYNYYGYLNDILARLNIYNFKVLDVPMPARYGKEKSMIKLSRFIFKVSFRLLKTYLWRLKTKYLSKLVRRQKGLFESRNG